MRLIRNGFLQEVTLDLNFIRQGMNYLKTVRERHSKEGTGMC